MNVVCRPPLHLGIRWCASRCAGGIARLHRGHVTVVDDGAYGTFIYLNWISGFVRFGLLMFVELDRQQAMAEDVGV